MIPLSIGLVGKNGRDLPLKSDERDRGRCCRDSANRRQHLNSIDLAECPVLSINRGFSAPIKLITDLNADDLAFLAAHDSDPFNRWQALQSISMSLLIDNVAALRAGRPPHADEKLMVALAAILGDSALEPAFIALSLIPPGESDIAREIGRDIDPDAIFRARTALRAEIGERLGPALTKTIRRFDHCPADTRPTRRAQAVGLCAMSRSTYWRRLANPRPSTALHGNTKSPTT